MNVLLTGGLFYRVLNHCMRFSQAYLKRYIAMIERINKAAMPRFGLIGEDNVVDCRSLGPDQVINRNVFIKDLLISTEYNHFCAAAWKIEKSQKVADRFKTR